VANIIVKHILRTEVASLLLIVAMFVLAGVSWSTAPERIPMHWNGAGEVDRFGSRAEGLLLLPISAAAVYLLLLVLPSIESRANDATAGGVYRLFRTVIIGVFFATYVAVHLWIRR
jgi:uncharacterized membrane protein